jgi:hypothetical protein
VAVTVKHKKVNAIPDDPAAVAAGEVVPSDWNDEHAVEGIYVQDAEPTFSPGEKALWVQTNVNGNPDDFTLWIKT